MKLEDVRRLHQRKYREELGWFLVEGEHLVLELQRAAVREPRLRVSEVYCTPEYADWQTVLTRHVVTPRQMAQISETRSPQGIAAVAPLLPVPAPAAGERALYLHQVQDPGNLGTILRSLAWFGGFRCLLGPGSVDVHNGKAVRASMGAIFHVPVEVDVAVEDLTARYGSFACLDLAGEPVSAAGFRAFDCYVFGSEAQGLPPAVRDVLAARPFTIPGTGAIDSLNLAATVQISLHELHRPAAP